MDYIRLNPTRLELCVGMICGSIPTLRPLFTEWRKRGSKGQGYYDRTGSAIKLDSYGHRAQKANLAATPQLSIRKDTRPFEPSTSEDRIVKPEDEHRILRTQDIEISFKSATLSGKNFGTHYEGWGAV